MNLPLVQKEADATERGIEAESTTELLQLGMFAVLVVLKGLAVEGSICAVFALIGSWLLPLSRVLDQHVFAKLIFALADITTHLTYECFGLMSEFVAVELVCAVTTVGALVTLIP